MVQAQKIYLIHAGDVSMKPALASFAALWPDARVMNLLEDSLVQDVRDAGRLPDSIPLRFDLLGQYCVAAEATAILFTCSAFGSTIEALKLKHSIPILTPNEALFEEVIERGGKVALLTTFGPSIPALTEELNEMLALRGTTLEIDAMLVEGAFDALLAGDHAKHDQIIADKVATLTGYNTIVFGQFSMASAAALAQKHASVPVLTTPDCAVRKLKKLLLGS
jgi:hypothetical protein